MKELKVILKTLTPLWTGGADGKSDRLHETGIIGSLRWWYEAIVRGLGGIACDPRGGQGCPDKEGNHCAVCELFGCTDWRRKFRLVARYGEAQCRAKDGLLAGSDLTLHLIEVKPLALEERWLLGKAVEVMCNHGAIGGKKTLKPPREDFGVLKLVKNLSYDPLAAETIQIYVEKFKPHISALIWPDLRWFFFVHGHYLERVDLNRMLGLTTRGKEKPSRTRLEQCLLEKPKSGYSKRLFSFTADGGRMWGYVDSGKMLGEVVTRLEDEFGIPPEVIIQGLDVLGRREGKDDA